MEDERNRTPTQPTREELIARIKAAVEEASYIMLHAAAAMLER